MSLNYLLAVPRDPIGWSTFSWEHNMHHQLLLDAMPPSDRFSVPSYMIDPQQSTSGGWLLDHGQAHADFKTWLPVVYGWWTIGFQEYGIASAQNLVDVDLEQTGQLIPWIWNNMQEHFIAENTLPLAVPLV
jgi:hypothetical protein